MESFVQRALMNELNEATKVGGNLDQVNHILE